jgi:metallophosphoesterase superfamily enzyme
MTFDLISDIHIDFWINPSNKKQEYHINILVEKLLPISPSDVLVIAGDLGHYNHQNAILLKRLREIYKYVLLINGNHDLYMVSKDQIKKYKKASINRLNEMILMATNVGCHYLTGQLIDIDGYVFGGTGMWHDDYFAETYFNMNSTEVEYLRYKRMNDCRRIYAFDRYDFFQHEYEKMNMIISECDVIVSHAAPHINCLPSDMDYGIKTFYMFDGTELVSQMKPHAVYCYGHIHSSSEIIIDGRRFIRNPLGYSLPGHECLSFLWENETFPETLKIRQIAI